MGEIQWYPGHMTRARRELEAALPAHDVVIEVLDARMPRASENPVIAECRGPKPCVKVLCKADLADPSVTDAWLRHLADADATGRVAAVAITTTQAAATRKTIFAACARLLPRRGGPDKPVRAMVCGIPNVGKSTLINTLMERKVAKVGDKPAVTRAQQKVVLKSGMILSDTPGIMWPKIEDPGAGYRLAFGGAIPDTAIDYESVATWGAGFLLANYAARLRARYKLDVLPATPADLLHEIGRRRGALRQGGVVDAHKAADVLLHDFRQGTLGRISLESPPSPVP